MLSMLDQYDGNPNYRKFLVNLPNLNLSNEVNENGSLTDNVISKILRTVGSNLHQAMVLENAVELKFVLHKSEITVENLQKMVQSIGSSVGTDSYDLTGLTVTEL
jgi:plasmid maintenance system antidote protein VapI